MLNPNFEEYKLPGALEMPEFIPVIDDADPRGVIGMAEPGTIPTAGAIANAVYNACGVRIRTLPITPGQGPQRPAGSEQERDCMKAFELIHPQTVAEATRLLAEGGSLDSIRPMGGGQDLLGTMKDYILTPATVSLT